jgi:polysaccharide biosynthesis/export protein
VRLGSFAFIVTATLLLTGCVRDTWDQSRPGASSGGTGVLTDGTLAERPEITGATDETPAFTEHGIRAPYGSAGEDASYEFGRGYKIGSGDKLSIRVIGEPELTNEYAVDGAGNISFPYLKSVEAGGRTAPEVQAMITHELKRSLLRNPQVSVQVASLRPFYILGEVTAAGSFPYQEGMTAQNAIAIAGGYSARADQTDVMLSRKTAKGTNTYQVPVTTQLFPGDVVYVRERWF